MTYSDSVDINPSWQDLNKLLQRWGVKGFVASMLEALGPLTILGAQIGYIGQPFLSSLVHPDRMQEIIRLLEEPDQTKAFVAYLQEDNSE